MDLVIRNARLANRLDDGLLDIAVADGLIAAIGRNLAVSGETYEAAGRLVCAGLIESHIHLDKSRIIGRCPPAPSHRPGSRRVNPVTAVAPLKKDFTVEDIHARAQATLRECLVNGTTRMRTQVELDPALGLRGFEAIEALAAEYRWAIDIEICVFPQDGLTNYPGTDELLVAALKRGAPVLGGAPRYDSAPAAQIDRLFALAREYDIDLDLHLDVGDSPDQMHIHQVIALTERYGRGGRVVAGHMAKLSLLPPEEAAALGRRLADAGIGVTVLPATDLYLMGRERDHAVVRGVADANWLGAHGVTCSLSSNNVLNPATPFGDCSLIRMANLHANVLQIGAPEELRELFMMLTDRSARLLNLRDYGLMPGRPADIVVIDAATPEQAIAEIRPPLAVWKRGRQTVIRDLPRLLAPA
ncbi:MAG TPA: amidohydrolase family protein [Stellaceae bacterium]|jgi:cytosine deaminase|nr:amidohydrolase family protein [Stellaceae bacterium]